MLVTVLLAGTLVHFLSDEWLTRGPHAARGEQMRLLHHGVTGPSAPVLRRAHRAGHGAVPPGLWPVQQVDLRHNRLSLARRNGGRSGLCLGDRRGDSAGVWISWEFTQNAGRSAARRRCSLWKMWFIADNGGK